MRRATVPGPRVTTEPRGRAWGTRIDPLWARAPLVLFRFPGLFAAVAVGALLLALAAGAYPLFISATAGRVVRDEIAYPVVSRYGAGIAYRSWAIPFQDAGAAPATADRQRHVFTDRTERSPYLDPVVGTVLGPTVSIRGAVGPTVRPGRLVARTDALEHVQVVDRSAGAGVWLTDLVAGDLHVRPGDRVVLAGTGEARVTARLQGTYEPLVSRPTTGYWRALSPEIHPPCVDCAPPPAFVLAPRSDVLDLARRLGARNAIYGWEAPVVGGALSLDQARSVRALGGSLRREMGAGGSLFDLFRCCGAVRTPGTRLTTAFTTLMPEVVEAAERRVAAIEGPVQLLLIAGLVVAATVIAGAGVFGTVTRRSESAFLFARGRHPGEVGVRGALESLAPAAVGGVAGIALAFVLVSAVGPEGPLAGSAIRTAILYAAIGVVASILLIGAVSGAAFLWQSEHHRSRLRSLVRFPWEIAVIPLAFVLLQRLIAGRALVPVPGVDVSRPSWTLLAFPVVFIGGFGAVAARLSRVLLGRARSGAGRSSPAVSLAVHRLAGGAGLAVLLVASSTLALGVFCYGRSTVASLRRTAEAKAGVFVGSDVRAVVDRRAEIPAGFPFPITKVTRIRGQARFVPEGNQIDLLVIDPTTFAGAAYWNDGFASRPLGELIAPLEDPSRGALRVLVVGDRAHPEAIELGQTDIPVQVVGRADAFPGTVSRRPLVVVTAVALVRAYGTSGPLFFPSSIAEFWVKGSTGAAVDALGTLGFESSELVTKTQVEHGPSIEAVLDTFSVQNLLALVAGGLIVAVLLLYLQARQRARVVSHALSRRMGLSDRNHRRALILELGAMLGWAGVVGLVLAVVAARVVVPFLDPLPSVSPDPLFVLPLWLVPVTLVLVVALAWGGGRLTDRRARAANLGEVMRVAD